MEMILMHILKIKDLTVKIENRLILDKFNLEIKSGEIHAIMGPNGTGKSTLSKVIMGDPTYEVISGEIMFDDKLLNDLELTKEDLVDEELKHKISIYIIKKSTDNEYIYHAFNSVFFDSIKEHGISPNIRFTPQDEIDKIDSILEE